MKNLKLISTVLLSVMLIFTISTAVFADNESDDIWSDVNVVEDNNIVENTVENTTNDLEDENEVLFENVEEENQNEEEYNNLYTTNNSTTTDSENLADTGIGDSSFMAIIVCVSAVIAIYSAIRFNEYKNI